MPVQVSWHPQYPERVVLIDLYGELTLENLTFISTEAIHMANNSPAMLIHDLIDTSKMERMPLNITQLKNAISPEKKSDKLGWVLIATGHTKWSQVLQFVLATMSHFFNFRFRMFYTMEEAEAFLLSVDDTLPAKVS